MLVDQEIVNDFEIVVGLVAPIGTNLNAVASRFSEALRIFGYDSETIRLSHLLDQGKGRESAGYYASRMDAGDALRDEARSGDAVAALAIAKLLAERKDARSVRKAWLLRTLKHDEEVALLRQVFGRRFVLVGVNDSLANRQRYLANVLKDEDPVAVDHDAAASRLIARDEMDDSSPFGQRVRETFSLADFFLDLEQDLASEVQRLIGLLFGEPFLTPTRDESSMFHAHAASLRSADPGRQVGAVISSMAGDILAVGTNEVPRHGGGEYWHGDPGDARDFQRGFDNNKRQGRRVLSELLDVLAAEGALVSHIGELSSDKRLEAVWEASSESLKKTRVLSLVEFGRIVHAEMSALMTAARMGARVQGATIYTTAFPCHLCMRLIVSSGIERVVYVDPYPKSLASDMYGDSITEVDDDPTKVKVAAYNGVGWSIYRDVFSGINRGRDVAGNFIEMKKEVARFRLADADPLIFATQLEEQAVVALSAATGKQDSNILTKEG